MLVVELVNLFSVALAAALQFFLDYLNERIMAWLGFGEDAE